MTYQAIGDELGVSHVMIRKIEQRALRKIREHPDIDVLWELLDFIEEMDKLDRTIYAIWR
jgi:DNA-directed RNA polymerase sigma subunit (sigma70/sigma32)